MAHEISRAEAWTRAHEVFTRVNFNAFDYNTIKESLLDYMKLYFPEDYNDFIESSEFIAILELFAYVGEILAYRLDLNAHENFISTAERKESILRLAKLISYKASRNIPARGLVKINSIRTSEQVIDAQGNNLANTNIIWNDLNNVNWKEQFLLVMNRVLEQSFGTVAPNERVQIEDVLFELYTWNNQPLKGSGITTFNYSVTSSGTTFPLELVPVELTDTSPVEKRPERNGKFSLLFGSDGLGDASDTTGFFLYTKQGTLQLQERSFDGVTPNQTVDLLVDNINETDIWLNNVDPSTREVLTTNPFATLLPHLDNNAGRYGEWEEVSQANAQNILFNTNKNRQKFETETLDADQLKLIFGDGEFSDIPNGEFDVWYRVSANNDSSIQKTAATDLTAAFSYLDITSTSQTFTFTFSLINTLQNASASEDIEHVRRVAPSVYYTQDRMVNGRDYNSFMLQDPSILKLTAVNRTFSGDSKYIAWHDPKEYYEDVKIFGEDLALFWIDQPVETGGLSSTNSALGEIEVITNLVEPLLCSADFYNIMTGLFENSSNTINDLSCVFSAIETANIRAALIATATTVPQVDLYYAPDLANTDEAWTVGPVLGSPVIPSVFLIRIEAQFSGSQPAGWSVRWSTRRMTAHSESTRFRNTNTTTRIINSDTLSSNDDNILILQANVNGAGDGLLTDTKKYNVLAQELIDQSLPNAGLPDDNRLSVLPTDTDDDGLPDGLEQTDLLGQNTQIGEYDTGMFVSGNEYIFPVGMYYLEETSLLDERDGDLIIEHVVVTLGNVVVTPITFTFADGDLINPTGTGNRDEFTSVVFTPAGLLKLNTESVTGTLRVRTKQYVYFNKATITSPWVPLTNNTVSRSLFLADTAGLYKREYGRYPLNFAWFYTTPRFHLVDPAASNIIDTFIITAGYYQSIIRWLENRTDVQPDDPTPLELRTAYDDLLQNSMISDTVILHPGRFKLLFGTRADAELRALFKVIRPTLSNLTDNEVKVRIVEIIKEYFTIENWDFGSTFYFTELAAVIHNALPGEINSIVLVPSFTTDQFGDLFQVTSREDEIFIPDVSTDNIEIIQSLTPENIRQ